MALRRLVFFSAVLAGFTAMASQIILMREFLVVFYGNELSIGFILFSWLLWGAIGSWILSKLTQSLKPKISILSASQILLSVFIPLSIIFIRSIKPFFGITTGEIIGFSAIILSSFLILAPTCMLLGFVFGLCCRIYASEGLAKENTGAAKIGFVYSLEAIGSITGGLLASFILIRLFHPLIIAGILSLLNILAAFCLHLVSKERYKNIFIITSGLFLITGICLWIFKGWDNLQQYSLKNQWRGYAVIASGNSIYGNITVTKKDTQVSFFNNGLHLYTIADKLTSEEAVHFTLLEHPYPESVLLLGGGVGGLVEEIIKHPVKKVDYLELDPLIIESARGYLSKLDTASLNDPRVGIKNLDARFFIKKTDEKYSCIIIHLGNPYTAQINRYYTVEFFQELKRALKEGGIISFGLSSSENYLSPELRDFLASIYFSLKEVFEDVKVIPGDTAYFLASDKKGVLTYDYGILMQRASERKIEIKYVREYYLFSKLSPGRIAYTENSLKQASSVKLNHDFRPISYYYDIIYWAMHFSKSLFPKILKSATENVIWRFAFGIYVLIFLLGLYKVRDNQMHKKATLIAVMTTGFAEISFQVVVLLSFQIIYGYLFYKLGLILTSFMIGLSLGAWRIIKIMPKLKNDYDTFIWTQVSICIYPLILPLFFWWLSASKSDAISWLGANIIFPFLPVIAGFIGGFQFPLANKIYLERKEEAGRVAGLSYALDLFGSCLGALLTGAFLIPILGIPKTCLVVSIMNFMVLATLIFHGLGKYKTFLYVELGRSTLSG